MIKGTLNRFGGIPETLRGKEKLFSKCFAERLKIGKAAFMGYTGNRHVRVTKLFPRALQSFLYSILMRANIIYLFKGAVKMKF
jgi:hypothetical protein